MARDFWENSPSLKRDLFENRRILVSVIDVEDHTQFKGVGLVAKSLDKTWEFATSPAKIKQFSQGLETFDWNLATGEAFASIKILWLLFSIKSKVSLHRTVQPPEIRFEFLEGSWIQLQGTVEFQMHASDHTLVILRASTKPGKKVGWHMAMEAVLQRIAGSLRSAVEKDQN